MIGWLVETFIYETKLGSVSASSKVSRVDKAMKSGSSGQSVSSDWLVEQWRKTIEKLSPDVLQDLIKDVAYSLQEKLKAKDSFKGRRDS